MGITYEGCCNGKILTWCEGGALETIDCSSNPRCGWNVGASFYDCGTQGQVDPSGQNDYECH